MASAQQHNGQTGRVTTENSQKNPCSVSKISH